jgi:hypothetical protein
MSVYGLLQQHWAGDRTADRLLDALRELAARVEVCACVWGLPLPELLLT